MNILLAGLFLLTAAAQAKYDPNHFAPDNAAHWYRKAFELYEEPKDIDLGDYIHGEVELSPEIRFFVEKQQPTIDLLKKAAAAKHCDWQFDPYENGRYSSPPYLTDVKDIAVFLLAEIRHKEDMQQDINIREHFRLVLQLASHLDSTSAINHLVSTAIRSMTYETIHEYLNRHPDLPLEKLYQAKALLQDKSIQPVITYKDVVTQDIENTRRILTDYKTHFYSDHFLTKGLGIPAEQLSDSFYQRNLAFYIDYMKKYQQFLDFPYPKASQEIIASGQELNAQARLYFKEYQEQLREKIEKYESELVDEIIQMDEGDYEFKQLELKLLSEVNVEHLEKCDFLYTALLGGPKSVTSLSIYTRNRTQRNALEAGISLLIRYRKKGKLPENLPPSLPKDLFSEKPFLIIKKDNGFKLKCQGENLSRHEFHEYEFVLPTD